jgi:molybdate transport system substrate-binding protein
VISAAASTKELVDTLARKFQQETGHRVHVNLGGSNTLAAQIVHGAPADLFFSADPQWVDQVAAAGLVAEQVTLLGNSLVLVTPTANPGQVQRAEDLRSAGVKRVAIASSDVPAGKYADQALQALGLLAPLVDNRQVVRCPDVRAVLSYVERGEAEVGVIYRTDALASRGVQVVCQLDAATHDPIVYVLARLKHGRNHPAAGAFYRFMISASSERLAAALGFRRPVRQPTRSDRSG